MFSVVSCLSRQAHGQAKSDETSAWQITTPRHPAHQQLQLPSSDFTYLPTYLLTNE